MKSIYKYTFGQPLFTSKTSQKVYGITALILLFSIWGITQSNFVTAPSASASSVGKQAAVPVNYNNGSANFNIPIHTISEYDLNLPISLSYQTGGIQVGQVASNVGLGWTLNAGGGVFRQVRGLPDEMYDDKGGVIYNGFYYRSQASILCDASENDCRADGEPDIFVYNLGGVTGKFFFDAFGEIVQVSANDIKIEVEWNYVNDNYPEYLESSIEFLKFTFTLPDGSKWIFDNYTERQRIWDLNLDNGTVYDNVYKYEYCDPTIEFTSSWYPNKIVSPTGKEIQFLYEKEEYILATIGSLEKKIKSTCEIEPIELINEESTPYFFGSEFIQRIDVSGYRIKTIEGTYSSITFKADQIREDLFTNTDYPAKRIDFIEVSKRNGSLLERYQNFKLNQTYFNTSEKRPSIIFNCNYEVNGVTSGFPQEPLVEYYTDAELGVNKRLKLNSIEEIGLNSGFSYETLFEYYEDLSIPNLLSFNQDFWGYNNGANNETLLPRLEIETNCTNSIGCGLEVDPPNDDSPQPTFAISRDPSLEHTQTGSLRNIDYPNGDFINLTYDLNSIRTTDHTSGNPKNHEVGGLRIKSINTSDVTRNFKYDGYEKYGDETSLQNQSYEMKLCHSCQYPSNSSANCSAETKMTDFNFIPCNSNINIKIGVLDQQCAQQYGSFEFCWVNAINDFEEKCIEVDFDHSQASYGTLINTNDFLQEDGFFGGDEYKFILRYNNTVAEIGDIPALGYLGTNVRASITIENTGNFAISGPSLSTGKLVSYPAFITEFRSNQYDPVFKGECEDDFVFFYNSRPLIGSNTTIGSHIIYGRVEETINDGCIGKSIYHFNTSSIYENQKIIQNNLTPEIPIVRQYPIVDEYYINPDFGSLMETETYDNDGELVTSNKYEYLFQSEDFSFIRSQDMYVCDKIDNQLFGKFSTSYSLRSYTVLPTKTTSYVDGMTTVAEIRYRNDLAHHNPIETISYALNDPDNKRVSTIKYAHELGLDQFTNPEINFVSIPMETLVENGLGGGSKTEYEIINGRIQAVASYTALNDGSFREIERITAFDFSDPVLPLTIKRRGANLPFEYAWQNGLLHRIKYDNRVSTFEYDDLRRLKSKIDNEDILTTYDEYDGFHRLKKMTSANGRIEEYYDYYVDRDDDESVTTTTHFLEDEYDIPKRVSLQYFDTKGRITKEVSKNHMQSGADLIISHEYDEYGRKVLSCDPSSGGCTRTQYESSPLSRVLQVTPPSYEQSVSYTYGVNGTDDVNGFPAESLRKSSVTDRNGNTSSSYTDVFGRKVQMIDALGQKTNYSYNTRDQLLEVVPPGASPGNADLCYSYIYTPDDAQLESKSIPGKGTYQYIYHPDTDVLVSEIMPNGHRISLEREENHLSFVKKVFLDGELIKEFTPYHPDFQTYWMGNERVKVLDNSNTWLETSYDNYDDLGRLKNLRSDYYQGQGEESYKYDLMGNLRYSQRRHTGPDGNPLNMEYHYDYDKGLRPIEAKAKFPGLDEMTIHSQEYNDNDWLIRNVLGDNLESTDLYYYPNGWLKSINRVEDTYNGDEDPCNENVPTPDDDDPCDDDTSRRVINMTYNCLKIGLQAPTALNLEIIQRQFDAEGQAFDQKQHVSLPLFGFIGEKEWSTDSEKTFYPGANQDAAQVGEAITAHILDCVQGALDANAASNVDNLQQSLEMALNTTDANPNFRGKLFAEEIYYHQGNEDLNTPGQFNGNISWVKWRVKGEAQQAFGYQYDVLNRLRKANYGIEKPGPVNCLIESDTRYNVNIMAYDALGNIQGIQRNGLMSLTPDGEENFGLIDDLSMHYQANQITSVSDLASPDRGYRSSGGNHQYQHGNLVRDDGNGLGHVEYNYLDLPTRIISDDGIMEILYDANGSQLQLKQMPNGDMVGHPPSTTIYHGGIEYKDNMLESIYHAEGRVVYNGNLETAEGFLNTYVEWSLSDHLGNVRIRFVDKDGSGNINADPRAEPEHVEVLGSYHYYPFGLKMEAAPITPEGGTFWGQQGVKNKYQYNGIEHMDLIGHGISLTTYRVHDAALGRWWQTDPKAEVLMGDSPYCAMRGNPISNMDPEGDLIFPHISFNGGLSVGVTFGIAPNVGINIGYNFSQNQAYASLGISAGPFSASIGTGGFGISVGLGYSAGGLSLSAGGVSLSNYGIDFYGPSASVGFGINPRRSSQNYPGINPKTNSSSFIITYMMMRYATEQGNHVMLNEIYVETLRVAPNSENDSMWNPSNFSSLASTSATSISAYYLQGNKYRGANGNMHTIRSQGWNQYTGTKNHMTKTLSNSRLLNSISKGFGAISFGINVNNWANGDINSFQFGVETMSTYISTFGGPVTSIAWTVGYEGLGRNLVGRSQHYHRVTRPWLRQKIGIDD